MSAATDVFKEPEWLWDLLGARPSPDGASVELGGATWAISTGIPRSPDVVSAAQLQTADTFGYKWAKRETFDRVADTFSREWLSRKYGRFASLDFLDEHGINPLVLDAGCGASLSGLALFEQRMADIRYLGADISDSVDIAAVRLAERDHHGGFLQCDLNELPIEPQTIDVIFSEGVLHHTDDTQAALSRLVRLLKPGGRVMFYVYKKKGPIREFTDDHIRGQLTELESADAWRLLEPLTALGIQLGELGIELDIEQPIDVLEIPAGKIDLQRFFYWHVFKAFYRPEMTFDEMQHINFDWYTPTNAHRHTPEEVRSWCTDLGLHIEHEQVEEAGITVVARKED